MSRTAPSTVPIHFNSDLVCRSHTGSSTGPNVLRSDRSRLVATRAWCIARSDGLCGWRRKDTSKSRSRSNSLRRVDCTTCPRVDFRPIFVPDRFRVTCICPESLGELLFKVDVGARFLHGCQHPLDRPSDRREGSRCRRVRTRSGERRAPLCLRRPLSPDRRRSRLGPDPPFRTNTRRLFVSRTATRLRVCRRTIPRKSHVASDGGSSGLPGHDNSVRSNSFRVSLPGSFSVHSPAPSSSPIRWRSVILRCQRRRSSVSK